MSVVRITAAAMSIARRVAQTASVARDAELEGLLGDLMVHLAVLRDHCADLGGDAPAADAATGCGDEPGADPVIVVAT